ncbi:hypothetical protein [Lentzea sp. HUAS12]|uniref:hypothetical protein n=1 Tax=Lentzea sp. HUAS12 TaxID=2951806 RepID=UPI00209CDA1B|nr:hypothetical protein [Lentzea sp. HUAS12]USX56445.1 hypothetical protein ND450_20790 [Lentzea sp. HUAS12]
MSRLVAVIEGGVAQLSADQRAHAQVDFNLVGEHEHPTLTERQESLARKLGCAAKTVRRHADQALETLIYVLLADQRARPDQALETRHSTTGTGLAGFWRLTVGARVDIVCSEIPDDERPEYAAPSDRNYLRYAKFADLDTLIYLRTRFAQLSADVNVRDFAPSEYYDTQTDVLCVVGGPPWNATFREFLPMLPFHFEPHPLGEDDPLVVPSLGLTIGPHWTAKQELLQDLAVLTRLTLGNGTTVFLFGGCLTLGVLGAARCLLEPDRGLRSADCVTDLVGLDDFVLVTEARRVGGLIDVPDLSAVEPLLLLARAANEPFTAVVDNTARYPATVRVSP